MASTMRLTTTITSIMAPTAGPGLAITTAGAHSSVDTLVVNSLEASECNQVKVSTRDVVAKASTADVVVKVSTGATATADVELKVPTEGVVAETTTEECEEATASTERAALAALT
jgi:hypothetical protein